jgi:hypothetical protein
MIFLKARRKLKGKETIQHLFSLYYILNNQIVYEEEFFLVKNSS